MTEKVCDMVPRQAQCWEINDCTERNDKFHTHQSEFVSTSTDTCSNQGICPCTSIQSSSVWQGQRSRVLAFHLHRMVLRSQRYASWRPVMLTLLRVSCGQVDGDLNQKPVPGAGGQKLLNAEHSSSGMPQASLGVHDRGSLGRRRRECPGQA